MHIGLVLLSTFQRPKQKNVLQSHRTANTLPHLYVLLHYNLHYSLSLSQSSLRSVVWFLLVSSKMLARLAANRLNEIRQIFRQVFFSISLNFPIQFHLPVFSFQFSILFLFPFSQPARVFSTALNYVSLIYLTFMFFVIFLFMAAIVDSIDF